MIELPTLPAGLVAVLGLLTPYAIALLSNPKWSPAAHRLMAVAVSLLVSVAAIFLYYGASEEPVPSLWQLILLGLLVSQAAYALIAKPSAKALETRTSRAGLGESG